MSSSSSSQWKGKKSKSKAKSSTKLNKSNSEIVRAGATSSCEAVRQLKFPLPTIFDNQIYNVRQTLIGSLITSSNVAVTYGALSFTLAQLDQAASLAAVFDQYRIRMIEVNFEPVANFNTGPTASFGSLYTVIDYDDATPLTSVGQAADYSNCLIGQGFEKQRRVFEPHVAVAAYSGAFTSFANEAAPWIDSNSGGVQHYGIKYAWTSTTVNAMNIAIYARFWVQFRNVR
jgi:hypothetical protein